MTITKSLSLAGQRPRSLDCITWSRVTIRMQRALSSKTTTTEQSNALLSSSNQVSSFLDRLSHHWSERSGTSEILRLKEQVGKSSQQFDEATAEVTHARRHLDKSLQEWEKVNGQHLQLLQRRESWTPEDASRFAAIVGEEISTRQTLTEARDRLSRAEQACSEKQLEYMNAMRKRYHEEQIWQDQWRVLGTYGTWSLIVLNTLVFMASQFFSWYRESQKLKAIERLILQQGQSQPQPQPQPHPDVAIMAEGTSPREETPQKEESDTKVVVGGAVSDEVATLGAGKGMESSVEPSSSSSQAVEQIAARVDVSAAAPPAKEVGDHKQEQKQKHPLTILARKYLEESKRLTRQYWTESKQSVLRLSSSVTMVPSIVKSPAEIDVPSALVGASVSGVVVLVATLLVTNSSHRKR